NDVHNIIDSTKSNHTNNTNNYIKQHKNTNIELNVTETIQTEDIKTQYKIGVQYYNTQDYTKAFKWFNKAASQGHADAQTKLGRTYEEGTGVEQDEQKAFKWFKKAAKQGHTYSQNNLGFMYNNGIGIKQNTQKAIVWYKEAAEKGYLAAQYNIGLI